MAEFSWWDAIKTGVNAYGQYSANEAKQDANAANKDQAAQLLQAGQFRPYATRNNIGSTSFTTTEQARHNQELLQYALSQGQAVNPQRDANGEYFVIEGQRFDLSEGYRQSLDPRFQQVLDQQVLTAQNAGNQASLRSGMTSDQLAKARMDQYSKFTQPSRNNQLDQVLGGIASQGMLGYGNSATGTNPIVEALARGWGQEDSAAYNNFRQQEENLTDTLLNRSRTATGAATGVENSLSQYIDQGSGLGGRNINNFAGSAAQMQTGANNQQAANSIQSTNGILNVVDQIKFPSSSGTQTNQYGNQSAADANRAQQDWYDQAAYGDQRS